jgi:N-acetylglutamate synthase-like GNAT family acetyltransferase
MQHRASGELSIRTATLADAPSICELLGELGYVAQLDETAAHLEFVLNHPDHMVLLSMCDEQSAGFAHAFIRSTMRVGQRVEIDSLVTSSRFRGHGVGSSLIAGIEAWARESRIPAISLSTNIRRHETHEFYKRRGFCEIKQSLVFERPVG